MPIAFDCTCGRKFQTAEENAGRSTQCPDCGANVVVPATANGATPPPLPAEYVAATSTPGAIQASQSRPVDRSYDRGGSPGQDQYARPYDRADAPYDNRYDRSFDRPGYDPYNDRIADRIRRRPPPPAPSGWTDKGVLAGVGMMAGGVLITVVGLYLGWLVYLGPILFIAGIVSIVKGVANGRA